MPLERRKLRVYGWDVVERDVGDLVFEYGGNRAMAPVIFGEVKDTPVLGALGYQVDPVSKELKPTGLLML